MIFHNASKRRYFQKQNLPHEKPQEKACNVNTLNINIIIGADTEVGNKTMTTFHGHKGGLFHAQTQRLATQKTMNRKAFHTTAIPYRGYSA